MPPRLDTKFSTKRIETWLCVSNLRLIVLGHGNDNVGRWVAVLGATKNINVVRPKQKTHTHTSNIVFKASVPKFEVRGARGTARNTQTVGFVIAPIRRCREVVR